VRAVLSIEELALAADLDPESLKVLERGLRPPSILALCQLGHAMNVAPEGLMTEALAP
jgi:transcriptional regulator with XRE-family HTH domain